MSRSNASCIRVILAGAMIAVIGVQSRSIAQEVTRQTVRDASARWREAIDTLDVRFHMLPIANGYAVRRDYHAALASGGKYSLTGLYTMEDGRKRVAANERTDGKFVYQGEPWNDRLDVSNRINILASTNTDDVYDGQMCEFFWLIIPAGRPLFKHLDQGAEFLVESNGDAETSYVVKFQNPRGIATVRCVLDPRHDWLPKLVELGPPAKLRLTVTRFQRSNGLYFPAVAEVSEKTRDGKIARHELQVDELTVNKPLDTGLFGKPGLVPGTLIMDHMKIKTTIHGGRQGREAFDKQYPPPSAVASPSKPAPSPLVATPESDISWATIISLTLSASLLGTVVLIHFWGRAGR